MHIAVVCTGYVGLVTGACFAEFGVDVTCVDVDEEKIEQLSKGVMPIYEPGLEQLVSKNSQAGRLRFTTDVRQAVEQALVIFLAVGTPPKLDGSPDLSYVEQAASSVADYMNGYKVIVTKSTVPIGTGEHIRKLIAERKKTRANFGVVSNPEFLREGAAINDFMRPDRVVIGSRDEEAIAIMKDLYRPLYLIEAPFVITSLEAAELTKYAANAFLATKVSFINEIANLCDKIGCDVHDVARRVRGLEPIPQVGKELAFALGGKRVQQGPQARPLQPLQHGLFAAQDVNVGCLPGVHGEPQVVEASTGTGTLSLQGNSSQQSTSDRSTKAYPVADLVLPIQADASNPNSGKLTLNGTDTYTGATTLNVDPSKNASGFSPNGNEGLNGALKSGYNVGGGGSTTSPSFGFANSTSAPSRSRTSRTSWPATATIPSPAAARRTC